MKKRYLNLEKTPQVLCKMTCYSQGISLDNISFLTQLPDIHNVKAAAEKAAINLEINKMPMGYKTYKRHLTLVYLAWQVQRILLARALYKILHFVLDEASSHLDIENEQKNQPGDERNQNKSRIAVAHRLETIKMLTTNYLAKWKVKMIELFAT